VEAAPDPGPAADAELRALGHQVLATHAHTFRSAAWLLPRESFDEVAIVYAFCRMVDELADTDADRDGLLAVAAELRGEAAPRPLVAGLLAVASRRGFSRRVALDLVDGALSDLEVVRLPDEAALLAYAYRVAGTVGCMTAAMFSAADPAARAFAVDLGVGMQLSNIARDVAEDAGKGRIYLPATWLAEAGVPPERVLARDADPVALGRVVERLLERAEAYYASAAQGFRYLPWRTRLAVAVAARTYRAIGRKVRSELPASLGRRTVLTTGERILHGVRGLLDALLAPAWRSPHDGRLHTAIAPLLEAR
jgi:phytoene synthase